MKKTNLVVFLMVILLILPSLNAQTKIRKRQQSIANAVGGFRLIAPANNWKFGKYPVDIKFEWAHQPGNPVYSIELEYYDNGRWVSYVNKPNLTKSFTVIRYAMNKGFRWRVLCTYQNGSKVYSRYNHSKYVPGAKTGNKKLIPKFYPVPVSPLKKKVLRNFPRNMTFNWLHSTKQLYRNYQIQVDMWHPRPRRWQSEMKNRTFELNTVTRGNSYNWRFPADRKGRWRVRGYKSKKDFTPWSGWKYFEYRARH